VTPASFVSPVQSGRFNGLPEFRNLCAFRALPERTANQAVCHNLRVQRQGIAVGENQLIIKWLYDDREISLSQVKGQTK
jgi:hypothetical protein